MSEAVLAPHSKRVPLQGLPAAPFQHPLDPQAAAHLSRSKVLTGRQIAGVPMMRNLTSRPLRRASLKDTSFTRPIEAAQKVPGVNRRDELIAEAVLSASSDKQALAGVIQAIDKISDSNLRTRLLEWLYFRRATAAIKDKQFEEAEKLASQVEGVEQRAYLHIEIAKGLFSRNEMQTHAREILDEAITEAKKAGATIFAARTLLTASNLYTKIDPGGAISLLTDAINCINRIEAPDFSSDNQTQVKMVERKGRSGHYPLRSTCRA